MRTQDMTQGSAARHILSFAVPLFIGNIFQQVYNLGDMMVTGYNLGDTAIAAIGATSAFYSLLIMLAFGLAGGYAINVAQDFGSHDTERLKRSTAAMLVLSVAGIVILTALSLLGLRPAMDFLNTPAEIYDLAYSYIFIICAGMGTTLIYNTFAAYLRAIGNSRAPLYFLIVSCFVNLAADLILIAGLGMGLAVSAVTTVLGQGFAAVLCARYIWKHYRELLPGRQHFAFDGALYRRMLTMGLAMAAMQCIYSIGSVILQRAINGLGNTIITAHTSARRIVEMFMMPLSTISSAASTFVGQNWGAGKVERIKDGIKKSLVFELVWSVAAAVVVFVCARPMIVLMTSTTDAEVIANATMNMHINFVFYPALGILQCLRNVMQAMGQKIAPMVSSALEMVMKIASSLWLIPVAGYVGASFTEPATWLACAALLSAIYVATRKKTFARCALEAGERSQTQA